MRTHGEGTITQRKDGRWQGALQVDGIRRVVYGKTRKEVVEKLEAIRRLARDAGAIPNPGKRTLGDLLDAWLETKAPNWKPRTLADYRELCAVHLRPALGSVHLSKLTPDRVARYLATWQRRGKARTALKLYRALSQALDLAVRWGWLAHNPCERVDTPRYRPQRKGVWTQDELRRFLQATEADWLWPLWVTAIATGCRIGELLALEWPDVDIGAGTITVDKSAQVIGGQRVVTTPKTQAGRRVIALPGQAVAALQAQGLQQRDWGYTGGLVFCRPDGRPLTQTLVAWHMRQACQRAGVPAMTPHGLRHLHASLLLGQGLPLPDVSRRLGHATPQVTLTIYAHALQGGDRRAAQALDGLLGG